MRGHLGNNKARVPLRFTKRAMRPLLTLCFFWLLPLALMQKISQQACVPRRLVPYQSNSALLFQEKGVFNYSNILLREDLGLLVVGSREAVFALDLKNISKKIASVDWAVTQQQVVDCKQKGKDPERDCKNYIRILHKMKDGRMYVCGTNAFDPKCKYMSYADGKLIFEKTVENGKGKCPFDPFQSYASIMVDDSLYSATSRNFLASEFILVRYSNSLLSTELKSFVFNGPTFVSMAYIPENEQSDIGDDDKIYLFFSETAVEYDCPDKLLVSSVARVCKGDQGGARVLQKKWTSFLKTRIDCPVLDSKQTYLIQDSYLWCDHKHNWKDCIFYATFTPQSDTSDLSAVCAYQASDISKVFSDGNYKTPVPIKNTFKWLMYTEQVPVPRPGACINKEARNMGITQTLDLPDQTLQFVRSNPLMHQTLQPIGGRPVLMRRGATFTRITVTQVRDADGEIHRIMFIGTEGGTVLKAVNYDGEMFIIEEVHVFQSAEPIKTLKFSNVTDHLYAGSDLGVAQIPLATCGRSLTCLDCVLARDPYCGWDTNDGKCVFLSGSLRKLIQSVKQGNAFLCPAVGPIKSVTQSVWPGGNLKLSCRSPSNLAKISWERNSKGVTPNTHLQLHQDGLLIFNASFKEAGLYRCLTMERSKANEYTTIVAEYHVQFDPAQCGLYAPTQSGLQAAVALLSISLLTLLAWNFYKRHLPLPYMKNEKTNQRAV